MTGKELKTLLEQAENKGINKGIALMKEKMLLACENGTPIEINGRAYWVRGDIENLRDIFKDLEMD